MRKSTLLALVLSAAALCTTAQTPDNNRFGARFHTQPQAVSHATVKAPSKVTVDDLLGCPEGTVYSGAYNSSLVGYQGFQNSDQGRTDFSTKYYQHISGCYYTFTGLRFYGFFNYWNSEEYNWLFCDERAGIDEDDNMTKPVRFEVTITKEAPNGEPGEVIYTKEFDLTGKSTGVQYGDQESGYQSIFAFDVELGETLKLETGFISVSAVKTAEPTSCWFSVFTCDCSVDYGMIQWDGEEYQYANLPMLFCLTGSGEMAADKALKLNRLMSPSTSNFGKYERVQVELLNAGKNTISDAALELWADGQKLSSETVSGTIAPGATHKYQFETRIDASTPGNHHYEIRNATPGDELLCADTYNFYINNLSGSNEVGASASETCDYNCITNVTIGDAIDNTTEASNYSDFTNLKATICPGDTLALVVTPSSQYAYTTAFVDWNNNGILNEAGEVYELDNYYNNFTAQLTIPTATYVEEGDRLVRIITSYDTPSPEGTYDYGETEDYTLTILRHDGTPAITPELLSIDKPVSDTDNTVAFTLANDGSSALTGELTYTYLLPNYPSNHFSTAEPVAAPKLNVRTNRLKAAQRAAAPAADAATTYTLRYDNGQYDAIGIENSDESTYAHLYPGNMLAYLKGMAISSVDVYIGEAASKTSVVLYGQNTQTACGGLICEQSFTAQPYSWNHIVLDNPVTITGEDIWVGVATSEFNGAQYHIGIDYGQAVRGFGDIVNIGGNIWWSMGDLGMDYNYCIRANVTGQPTDAINWLSADKTTVDVKAGDSDTFTFTLDASKLDSHPVYEALVEVKTNDELCPLVSVPVYLTQGNNSGLAAVETTPFSIEVSGNLLTVHAADTVAALTLTSVAGQTMTMANGNTLSTANVAHGIYVLSVRFADGTTRTAKLALK